jgi:hypothetical protein
VNYVAQSLRQLNTCVCFAVLLFNPALAGLDFSLARTWVSNSPSNTRRRLLLKQEGLDQIVVGVQVRTSAAGQPAEAKPDYCIRVCHGSNSTELSAICIQYGT